jgi:hypothetical protein
MIDVFKIGVGINMTTNASQVISVLMRDMLGLNIAAGKVEATLGRVGKLAAGLGMIFGGVEILKTMPKLLAMGDKLVEQQVKLKALGVSDAHVTAATNTAVAIVSSVPGSVLDKNLALIRELRGVLKDTAEASAAAPAVATMQQVLAHYGIADSGTLSLLKALDIKGSFIKNGQLDVGALTEAVHAATAALSLTGGLLTPQTFYRFTRLAGPAAAAMDTTAYLKDFTEVQLALGPSGGRGMSMAAKTFLGGSLTKPIIGQLEALHLLNPGDISKDHGHYSLKAGHHVAGYDELTQRGFVQWFHDVVQPALTKGGFTGPAGVMQALSSLPQTEARLFTFFETNWAQIQKFGGQFDQAAAADPTKVFNDGSYIQNMKDLSAAWESFTEELGKDMVPIAIKALKLTTSALQELFALTVKYPEAAKDITGAVYAFGGLLVLGGSMKIMSVALGPFASGLKSLVGTGAGITTVGTGLTAVATGFEKLLGPLGTVLAIVQEAHLWGSTNSPIHPDNNWGWGNSIHPNKSGPRVLIPGTGSSRWGVSPGDGVPIPGKQSMNQPILVHVVGGAVNVANAGQMRDSIITYMADGTSRPQSGPNYEDYRMDLPSPGHALS